MASSILEEHCGELHHVAWPTRATIIYTILVIAISIIISLYLGFSTTSLRTLSQGLNSPNAAQPAAQIEGVETNLWQRRRRTSFVGSKTQ